MLAYLYRLRWQVELIFRTCKSTLRLDQARSDNEYRTQGEIWARLIGAVLVFLWHAHTNAACWLQYGMETRNMALLDQNHPQRPAKDPNQHLGSVV
jgi:hypothetical protein